MLYVMNVEMSEEVCKTLFQESYMVDENEWSITDEGFRVLFRREWIDGKFMDEWMQKVLASYWLGMTMDDIEIMVEYELKVRDGCVEVDFIDYHTYVEGFQRPVEFDVYRWNKEIEEIVEDWEMVVVDGITSIEMEEEMRGFE